MTSEPPVWGTPPQAPGPAPEVSRPGRYRPEPGAPGYEHQVRWQHSPRGISPATMDADLIRRQSGVAIVVNLLVLCFAGGLLSLPGVVMAMRARALAPVDPGRARRSLMWSWIWLASNLLLYLLVAVLVVVIVLIIFT